MIRLSALAVYVTAAALYAWKDWYKSLCALILLMAVVEHPDMPKTILGIQGLNPWNLLLIAVVAAWATSRAREGLKWDLPRHISVLLVLYLGVILVGFARMILDRSYLDDSVLSLTSEHLVNTIKWVVPGLLLYDGCRTNERFRMAMATVLGVYVLLAIQVIRWMPLSAATDGDSLSARSLKILQNEVGYHRVNMSAMLAGASWAIFAAIPLLKTPRQRWFAAGCGASVLLAQALTGGRAGYVTCAMVGLVLCVLRWRKILLLAPVGAVAIAIVAPGVVQRMFEGFTPDSRSVPERIQELGYDKPTATGPDAYTITAGRIIIWPFVIEKIRQRPIVGYGRLAMVRTGLTYFLATKLDEGFAHPHNAYLEMLLDNGLIGFVIVMPFYGLVVWYAFVLVLDSRSSIYVAVGGSTLAIVLGLLIAGMGSQTFYPREGWVGMWCLIFLMLRVRRQRRLLDLAPQATAVAAQAARARAAQLPRAPVHWPVNPATRPGPVRPVPVAAATSAAPAVRALDRRLANLKPVMEDHIAPEALWAAAPVVQPPLGRPLMRHGLSATRALPHAVRRAR
jgi:O-antigen ligase